MSGHRFQPDICGCWNMVKWVHFCFCYSCIQLRLNYILYIADRYVFWSIAWRYWKSACLIGIYFDGDMHWSKKDLVVSGCWCSHNTRSWLLSCRFWIRWSYVFKICWRWPFAVAIDFGRCLRMRSDINMGQVVKNPLLTDWIQVDRNGEKAVWRRNVARSDFMILWLYAMFAHIFCCCHCRFDFGD